MDFIIGLVTGVLAVWIWYSGRRLAKLRKSVEESESRLARRVYTLTGRVAELTATVRELEFERQRARGLVQFDGDMTLGDAFEVHPRVREVFAAFGVGGGGCSGGSGLDESLSILETCREYSLDSANVLGALRRFLENPDGPIEARAASAKIYQIRQLPPSPN